MRRIEDKKCYSSNKSQPAMKYNKGGGNSITTHQQLKGSLGSLVKPTPSKWDDAQKWLAGLSRGGAEHGHSKTSKPRDSNAEDRRLIAPSSQIGRDSCASADEGLEAMGSDVGSQEEGELKKIDCGESFLRTNSPVDGLRSVCVRDMGTEMTPASSLEPSRTTTPIRVATTPSLKSAPICSRSSTPRRPRHGGQEVNSYHLSHSSLEGRNEDVGIGGKKENGRGEEERRTSSLESRAMAWDEAERAKYTARYKREEVKIQAWESHQKRRAEMEIKRMEVKAERKKARAQEKLANKLASTRRRAEEKRANAETKLNEQTAKTSERADYIRRTGHLPSSFSFNWPSLCR